MAIGSSGLLRLACRIGCGSALSPAFPEARQSAEGVDPWYAFGGESVLHRQAQTANIHRDLAAATGTIAGALARRAPDRVRSCRPCGRTVRVMQAEHHRRGGRRQCAARPAHP